MKLSNFHRLSCLFSLELCMTISDTKDNQPIVSISQFIQMKPEYHFNKIWRLKARNLPISFNCFCCLPAYPILCTVSIQNKNIKSFRLSTMELTQIQCFSMLVSAQDLTINRVLLGLKCLAILNLVSTV